MEEAGTYVTDDESIGQSVCLSVSLIPPTPKQGGTSSYCRRTLAVVPHTADTCSSSVERDTGQSEVRGHHDNTVSSLNENVTNGSGSKNQPGAHRSSTETTIFFSFEVRHCHIF